jgi:hypothetical protein
VCAMAVGKIGRRDAIVRIAGTALLPSLGGLAGCADGELPITLGPWPARPSDSSMAIWCEAEAQPPPAQLFDEAGPLASAMFEPILDGIWLARFDSLAPDTEYRFEVDLAEGSFRTLPLPSGVLRLAIGADIHPSSKPYTVFDLVRERAPHLFLGLGDHIYADLDPGPIEPTPEAYDAMYRATWDDPSLRACWANVASLLVWDDHETWNDFDASAEPIRAAAASASYERMQRSRSPSEREWTILDAGPASLFVLDTRSFRSANRDPDGPAKTMLGVEQRDALFAWLAERRGSIRIVASPTPLHRYADTGVDAWAHGFAYERDLVLAEIAANDPSTVVVVSGDQHWPGVFELPLPGGGTVLELMCTPIAAFSRVAPEPVALEADALYVGRDHRGFGWLEIDGSTTPARVSFAWIDDAGMERFSVALP